MVWVFHVERSGARAASLRIHLFNSAVMNAVRRLILRRFRLCGLGAAYDSGSSGACDEHLCNDSRPNGRHTHRRHRGLNTRTLPLVSMLEPTLGPSSPGTRLSNTEPHTQCADPNSDADTRLLISELRHARPDTLISSTEPHTWNPPLRTPDSDKPIPEPYLPRHDTRLQTRQSLLPNLYRSPQPDSGIHTQPILPNPGTRKPNSATRTSRP